MNSTFAFSAAIAGFCVAASAASAAVLQSPNARVDVAVVLKYRHADQLERLLDAQADDSSPLYHHFLTSAQFEDYFAPTAAEYADTIAGLRSLGFTITNTFPNRTVLDATTTAATAERVFSTPLRLVRRDDGRVGYLNLRAPTVPKALATEVFTVVGLDSVHALRPQHVLLPAGAARPSLDPGRIDGTPLFGPDGGYGPEIYRRSYGFPPGLTGQGRASGVVSDADFLSSDLKAYLRYFGIARTGPTYRVFVDGGPPRGILTGDSLETTLDVETLVSLAPGTAMYVYEGKPQGSSLNFVDSYNQAVSDNKVDTLNTSFSQCETLDPTFTSATEAIEAQGSALGITFHSATGDAGSLTYGCGLNVSVAVPAATTHNVAVGGTFEEVDHSTGRETSETGWNDGSGITGGGVSTVFALPKYQRHVKGVIASGRNIPDVSFDASAFTGESLFYDYNFNGPVGGTSVSSPLFGAGLTLIDQMTHSRAGFFNPTLYNTWRSHGYSERATVYFRDITSGSIPPTYLARRGYDQVSGIGAMLFKNFGSLLR